MARRKSSHPGCLFLFSIPFAGVGAFMMYMTMHNLWTWRAAKSWPTAAARLQSVDLRSYSGDDSTTYKVEAAYTYRYAGRQYHGTRVGLSSGSDNLGDYHQRVYSRLKAALDNDQAVEASINPDDPAEAYLDLELRWGMLVFFMVFVLTFGGVGFTMMGVTVYMMAKRMRAGQLFNKIGAVAVAKLAESQRASAGEPSLLSTPPEAEVKESAPHRHYKRESTEGPFVYETAGTKRLVRRVVMAIAINSFVVPMTWGLWPKLENADFVSSLWLILPLIGAIVAAGAVMDLLHWRRFGVSTLSIRDRPKSGRVWSCVLTNNAILRFEKGFVIKLKKPASSRGKDDPDVWAENTSHPLREGEMGLYLPFSLSVPASDEDRWLIEITADIPGVDYRAEFDVKA